MSKNRQHNQNQNQAPTAAPTQAPAEAKQETATQNVEGEAQVTTDTQVSNTAIDPNAATTKTASLADAAPQSNELGLTHTTIVPVPAEPTPVVTIAPLGSAVTEAPSDAFELPLSASAAARMTITELKDYVSRMSSRVKLANTEGGQLQSMLYHILIQAINTPAEEFETVFGLTMKIIRANLDGAFNEINVHRYTPHVSLNATQAGQLRYLVNALIALAEPAPETRKIAMRQINIEQALAARVIKEEARQRVLTFFNYN